MRHGPENLWPEDEATAGTGAPRGNGVQPITTPEGNGEMAETAETLRISYDRVNDVLRVRTTTEPVDAIALPGPDVTLLMSEGLDRMVGMDFDNFLPVARRRFPETASDDEVVATTAGLLEMVVPPVLNSCAPAAKDAIVDWLRFVTAHDKS